MRIDPVFCLRSCAAVPFRVVAFVLLFTCPAFSLGFGTMGNLSASMGGAGVALRSPFALYYNPALIASEARTRFGYSVGVGVSEHALHTLGQADLNNVTTSLTKLGKNLSLSATPVAGGVVVAAAAAGGNSTIADVLKDTLKGVLGVGDGSKNLSQLITDFKKDKSKTNKDFAYEFKRRLGSSCLSADAKSQFSSMADYIDAKNLSASGANLSSITIKKGSDPDLDRAMSDLADLSQMLRSNHLNVRSQSGVAITLSSGTMKRVFGSVGLAVFNSSQLNMSIRADQSKMRMIVGSDSNYNELTAGYTGYTFRKSDQNAYNNHSLLKSLQDGNVHKAVSSVFGLTEIPVGYAYTFYFRDSNLNLGAAFKYMHAVSLYRELMLGMGGNFRTAFDNIGADLASSRTFGLDVGLHYEMDLPLFRKFGAGLVAKNVNTPTFRFGSKSPDVSIRPQYRFGVAYNGGTYSFAFDADLWMNDIFSYSLEPVQSQVAGGGVKADMGWFDIRGGAAYDFRQDYGVIMTAGLNLLGFLDVAVEVGTKLARFRKYTFPRYASVRMGGSFSF